VHTDAGNYKISVERAAAFIIIIAFCQLVMPDINEVPENFSATVLWRFRMASLGTQIIMWTTIGLLFGALTERSEMRQGNLTSRHPMASAGHG
jgi:predicted cobalt transporter CbtA